jgi:hypothetical protein
MSLLRPVTSASVGNELKNTIFLVREKTCFSGKNLYDGQFSINASGGNRCQQPARPGFGAPFTDH